MTWSGPNPKPEPHRKTKDRKKRQMAKSRAACREIVYTRARGRCEQCRRPLVLLPKDARHEFELAHIDEIKPRSLGGDPTDPDNCQCLCYKCHPKEHGIKVADS